MSYAQNHPVSAMQVDDGILHQAQSRYFKKTGRADLFIHPPIKLPIYLLRSSLRESTSQEIAAWIAKNFSFRNSFSSFLVDMQVQALFDFEVRVTFTMRVIDRDGERWMGLLFSETLNSMWVAQAPDRTYFLSEFMRRALERCIRHELDESIYLEGKRIFDPHKNDTR